MATLSIFENETNAVTSILAFFFLDKIFHESTVFTKEVTTELISRNIFFGEIILRFSTALHFWTTVWKLLVDFSLAQKFRESTVFLLKKLLRDHFTKYFFGEREFRVFPQCRPQC